MAARDLSTSSGASLRRSDPANRRGGDTPARVQLMIRARSNQRHAAVRWFAAGAAAAALLVLSEGSAQAAISFVNESTGQTSVDGGTSVTLTAPAAITAGDVEIATVSLQGTSTISPPSGWTQMIDTQLGTSLRQTSFWHIASANEQATTWGLSPSTQATAGIAAYRGADTTTIVDASAALTGTSGVTATAPSATTNYDGDLVLGIGSFNNDGSLTEDPSTTNRYNDAVGATTGPTILAEDATQSSAGATTQRTITDDTSSTAWIGQVITLKTATAAGVLSLQTTAAPSFSANLNAGDQTQTYTLPLTTIASVSPSLGWNETITSTQFTSGSHTLPASASTITAAPTAACYSAYANCTAPTNSVTYPVNVPAGAGPPTPVKFFNAANNSGAGQFTVTPTIGVLVPQNSFAGSYASTLMLAIVSGP
jgi:hypothetical protein